MRRVGSKRGFTELVYAGRAFFHSVSTLGIINRLRAPHGTVQYSTVPHTAAFLLPTHVCTPHTLTHIAHHHHRKGMV